MFCEVILRKRATDYAFKIKNVDKKDFSCCSIGVVKKVSNKHSLKTSLTFIIRCCFFCFLEFSSFFVDMAPKKDAKGGGGAKDKGGKGAKSGGDAEKGK